MPCYEPPRERYYEQNSNSPSMREIKKQIKTLVSEVGLLSAALCAISTELNRKGRIDLMPFLIEHKNDDSARLTADIHKRYSVDELEMIKNILKQGEDYV